MTPMSKLLIACVMSLAIGGEFAAHAATLPQLPRAQVDVTLPAVTGNTYNVTTCGGLPTALTQAAAANLNQTHEIIITANLTCTGSIALPAHQGGTGWIIIKGTNYASLPPAGTRVTLADAALMPKLQYGQGNNSAVYAATNAQRYRFIGIEFVENTAISGANTVLLALGLYNAGGSNTGYFVVDRCVFYDRRAAASTNTRRGILGNADVGHVAMIDSHCEHIAAKSAESQCFQLDQNPGPFLVRNNYLEAGGEVIMLCGGNPANAAVMPQDGTVRLNRFTVNPAWFAAAGNNYTVKSLFEFKCGVRILVEANDFDSMPLDGVGFAHRMTPRNESGNSDFIEVSDVTFRYNRYSNITAWFQIMGSDDGAGGAGQPGFISRHSKRWYIHDNIVSGLGWQNVSGFLIRIQTGGTAGTAQSCTDPVPTCKIEDLSIVHNTIDSADMDQYFCMTSDGQLRLDFRDNLIAAAGTPYGTYDCNFNQGLYGTARLNTAWGATWSYINNSIGGTLQESTALHPQGTNTYYASHTSFLWTNRAAHDYTLQPGSPAKSSASDGTDRGVNFAAYNAARSGGNGGDLTPPSAPQDITIR